MERGLYLRGVMDLLGLSESAVNKLVNDGHISFNRIGTTGKRVFNKNTVQEFKSSPIYRSLKKQSIFGEQVTFVRSDELNRSTTKLKIK